MANPATRRRIHKARAKDPTQLVAKTRVVALGHLDPDLASVSRDAPTPSRTSECILLAIYIAGRNQLMENDPTTWSLWCGDVSTAFLQGQQDMTERPSDLYLLPPQDEITRRAQSFPAALYRIRGNVYGLASAPKTWYKEVSRRFLSTGYLQHSLSTSAQKMEHT